MRLVKKLIGFLFLFAIYNHTLNADNTFYMGMTITPSFSLDTVNPNVNLTTPNGCETLFYNSPNHIQWNIVESNLISNPILIELSLNNGANFTSIAPLQANTGEYLWTVPAITTLQAKIRITATDSYGNTGNDDSDYPFRLSDEAVFLTPQFTIDTINPQISVLSPNGGEKWLMNTIKDITWNATDSHFPFAPVTIDWSMDNGSSFTTLTANEINDSCYPWTIPAMEVEHAKIRITVIDCFGNTSTDCSDAPFVLQGASVILTPNFSMDTINPQVTVISPNGGETFMANMTRNITWSATDSNLLSTPIMIDWSTDDGVSYSSLATNEVNDDSYLWQIPSIESSHTIIRVIAVDRFGNSGSDISNDHFRLPGQIIFVTSPFALDTVNPICDLLSPDGGEVWYVGERQNITWTASDNHLGAQPVNLEYVRSDPDTIITIQPALANNGVYSWLVPDNTPAGILMRLTITDVFGNSAVDSSQNPFDIGYATLAIPQNVTIKMVNSTDAVITWEPVTQNELGIPIEPTSYYILCNQTTDPENDAVYFVLGSSGTANQFTHINAGMQSQQTFYRVVAVVSSEDRISRIGKELSYRKLSGLKSNPLSMPELKHMLLN